MDILSEAKSEADRLLVAGASLARGDFRIKKLLPALDAAAASAPVIGRVAQAMRRAIGEADASAALGASGGANAPDAAESDAARAPNADMPEAELAADALMEARALLGAIAATQGRVRGLYPRREERFLLGRAGWLRQDRSCIPSPARKRAGQACRPAAG